MSTNENWFILPAWENDQKERKIRLFDLYTSHSICSKEEKKWIQYILYYLPLLWYVEREDVWDKFLRLNFSQTMWQIKQSRRYKISKILGRILHKWHIVSLWFQKQLYVQKYMLKKRKRKQKCYTVVFSLCLQNEGINLSQVF